MVLLDVSGQAGSGAEALRSVENLIFGQRTMIGNRPRRRNTISGSLQLRGRACGQNVTPPVPSHQILFLGDQKINKPRSSALALR